MKRQLFITQQAITAFSALLCAQRKSWKKQKKNETIYKMKKRNETETKTEKEKNKVSL